MHNPGVWVVNHVIAQEIEKISNGYNVIKPIISFQGINANNVFKSLDQLIMARGKYRISVDIIDIDTEEVIAKAELDKEVVEAPNDGFTHSVNCTWKYLVISSGVFAYRIFANDINIASFPIAQFRG